MIKNPNPVQLLFFALVRRKKCVWCKKKFPEGIILKTPEQDKKLNPYLWFTPDFLIHVQTTHGFSPEMVDDFLKEISTKRAN